MRSIRKYQTERTISITKPNVTFIGIFKKGNKLKKNLRIEMIGLKWQLKNGLEKQK